jgi:hypothetical protein
MGYEQIGDQRINAKHTGMSSIHIIFNLAICPPVNIQKTGKTEKEKRKPHTKNYFCNLIGHQLVEQNLETA